MKPGKRHLILGSAGQLGTDLLRTFKEAGLEGDTTGVARQELDIRDHAAVHRFIADLRPDTVFNASAYNLVDKAEKEGWQEAWAVNADAVQSLARACEAAGSTLVHFSTDYVFSGSAKSPYKETDPTGPLGRYAKSKLAGEEAAGRCRRSFVFRVCGLFGIAGRRGVRPNFVERMLSLAAIHQEIRVVRDQVLTPSYTLDVARKAWQVVKTGRHGLYHVTNSGSCSFHEFAQAIFELAGVQADLKPTTLKELGAPAPRPPYSVLAHEGLKSLGLDDMPTWRNALERYLKERETVVAP